MLPSLDIRLVVAGLQPGLEGALVGVDDDARCQEWGPGELTAKATHQILDGMDENAEELALGVCAGGSVVSVAKGAEASFPAKHH